MLGENQGSDDPIHRYTRLRAITEGILVDVTGPARGLGFRIGTCITRSVWDRFIAPESEPGPRLIAKRIGDTLRPLHFDMACLPRMKEAWRLIDAGEDPRADAGPPEGSRHHLAVTYCHDGEDINPVLLVNIGPDDEGEPCLTIGLPEDF